MSLHPGWFQSTPSLRKVTEVLQEKGIELIISIHTFLAEGDIFKRFVILIWSIFQSTPSLRKVTSLKFDFIHGESISIHTFLAEGDMYGWQHLFLCSISIHTFLAEGDRCKKVLFQCIQNFNPHLPCGRWLFKLANDNHLLIFQSTPSLRKVTLKGELKWSLIIFQSTPSLRKVTFYVTKPMRAHCISIHTFLAEGD